MRALYLETISLRATQKAKIESLPSTVFCLSLVFVGLNKCIYWEK